MAERYEFKIPRILINKWKTIREDRGILLKELSEKTGINYSLLSMLENNRTNGSFRVFYKLSKFYNVSFYEVYDIDGSMKANEDKDLVSLFEKLKERIGFGDSLNNLRKVRQVLGYSRDEVAETLMIDPGAYTTVEGGRAVPGMRIVWGCVLFFRMPFELLFDMEGYYNKFFKNI